MPEEKIMPEKKNIQIEEQVEQKQKKITFDIDSIVGNSNVLLCAFRAQAKRENWSTKDINGVCKLADKMPLDFLKKFLTIYCKKKEVEAEKTVEIIAPVDAVE